MEPLLFSCFIISFYSIMFYRMVYTIAKIFHDIMPEFPFPDVIVNIIFTFCNPFKELHEKNQETINRCFDMYQKKRDFDIMTMEINREYHDFTQKGYSWIPEQNMTSRNNCYANYFYYPIIKKLCIISWKNFAIVYITYRKRTKSF